MVKVSKFGGSSVANSQQFKKVKNIVESDDLRRIVVVSASGKQNKDDYKITDLLYLCHAHLKYNIKCDNIFNMIESRFLDIAKDLGLKFDIKKELDLLREQLDKNIDLDYLVSRGEYLTSLLMAEYLGYQFIDAKDLIHFHYDGRVDYEKTQKCFDEVVNKYDKILVPGFYGALPNGDIKIMSRGGGDVTGAIMANVADAEVYENWTDVPGILMADPRIVKNPKGIDVITYRELRELSYMGASVLHEEAVFPVKDKDIPIHILNTNDMNCKGTIIRDNTDGYERNIITGIAGKKDFSIITIKKNHMSNEVGLIRKSLLVLEKYDISIEHIPSGIDSFSIVVESASIKQSQYEIMAELKKVCQADEVTILNEISLIATVSGKMKNRTGISGRLFTALGDNGINVVAISQTSDEINIIVGVHNKDYANTIKAIYEEFKED